MKTIPILLAILLYAASILQASISAVTFFGDSLTDTGNAFTASFGLSPASPYYNGRYSNGPVYAEQLGYNSSSSLNGGSNYAFGGATTSSTLTGLESQVTAYTTASGGAVGANEAIVLWIGGNDVLSAIQTGDPSQASTIINNGLNVVLNSVVSLQSIGANNIVVMNLPNLALTPGIQDLSNPSVSSFATGLTNTWNNGISSIVGSTGIEFN